MNQIGLFLHQVKRIVGEKGFIFVERKESLKFMVDHDLTMNQLQDLILSLEPRDCFDGPEPDRDPNRSDTWTVAEFSPNAFGETLYLKLSIRFDPDYCKCLSVKLYRERPEVS